MENSAVIPDAQRKKFHRFAISSALFGCVTEQLLDTNSLIIIYLMALGGNESFSMLSATLTTLCGMFLYIPSAGLASRIGLRLSYSVSCIGSAGAFCLMAAAPWIVPVPFAKYVVIIGCFIFCLLRFPYSVAWFPMLDVILKPEERAGFFGKMRFSYMLLNASIIYGIGKLMSSKPPLIVIQAVLATAGILMLGRKFFMDRMPDNPEIRKSKLDIRSALNISIRNAPLVGFSFYVCFFGMATAAVMPLSVIYMKKGLNFSEETIMTITSVYILGMIAGYAIVGKTVKKLGTKWFQILIHTIGALCPGCFAFILPGISYAPLLMGIVSFAAGVSGSFMLCLNSMEMLATAKPGNKIMATAFCQTLTHIGSAVGRGGTTLILAAGVLAPQWKLFGLNMSCYNFLFIFFFITAVIFYILLLLVPSVVPRHSNYYNPQ